MREDFDNGDRDFKDPLSSNGGDLDRILEWEIGLPSSDELIPLSQSLISPELASAFSIKREPPLSVIDVQRAIQDTVSTFRCLDPSSNLLLLSADEPMTSNSRKEGGEEESDPSTFRLDGPCDGRAVKRPRLVWTPQLHRRFVEVVTHLGEKRAVPKTIMKLMNVGGLTRENVASHLQKYRLYLKRMQGTPNEGPLSSVSDHHRFLPASRSSRNIRELLPPPAFPSLPMIPFPAFGLPHHQEYGGLMGSHQPYGASPEQGANWSGGNKGSIFSYRLP
ncbi:hypothetical protein HPP92_019359 [Vanilla planifolia]|uniref:HTH myb-type domain-containing protein n=1 Tax=Vanilla planifolia TaxID=51239 RepID=A0A835Q6N4_VANPL|nr:hypothetical protein HPP92_019359 [Vanilla planifolia]